MLFAALVLAGVCAGAAPPVSYCGAKMCGRSNDHTFCQYPPGPSPQCRGYMEAALSADEKARVVARLNRRRSEAASGRLRKLTPAGNMLKLRWVEDLAREAQRWADQCRPPSTPDERDACRDLFSTSVGQCVASVVGEAPGLRVESLVDVWYMQSMHYRGNVTHYIPPMSNISFYGDFAQMVWARSYMVGCGRSRFMSKWNGRLRSVERLVCNIAPRGPLPSRPLWAPAVPTSVCPPRSVPDSELITLCNYQRDLDVTSDVDGAMTIEEHVLLSIVLEIENNKVLNYPGSLDELYMTKLAVVTMDSGDTTLSYNPVHKRDIIETLGLDENVVHIDNIIVENDLNGFMNATRIILKISSTSTEAQFVTKKANVIGRPKSYNVEDLDDVVGDRNSLQLEMNHHDDLPHRDMSKVDRDVYMDYAFMDFSEENTSTESEALSTSAFASELLTNISTVMINNLVESTPSTEDISKFQTPMEDHNIINYPNRNTGVNRTASIIDFFTNATQSLNMTNVTFKSDDDYFSDPETVRELQEALDRMEKSLVEKPPATKVRRELRNLQDTPPEAATEGNLQQVDESVAGQQYSLPEAYQKNALLDGNRTDKSPMLNMVLKYLPYLKPYQKEILGGAVGSSGSTLVISYVLLSFGVITFFSQ